MLISCAECGAAGIDELTCWDRLGWILSWEWQDAELAVEHFLTVACYNLQHPAMFTDEALAYLRQALVDWLDNGTADVELRRRASAAFEGRKRVLKKEAERAPVLRQWALTSADVYLGGNPQGAAARVRAWAESIRRELVDPANLSTSA